MGRSWNFDTVRYVCLEKMMHIISPSMEEGAMVSHLRSLWDFPNVELKTDVMGNLHAIVNERAEIHVGLVAHMDTVAVQLSQFLSNGAIRFRSIGLRPHVLLGQRIQILTKEGFVKGVVGFDPMSQYGQPKGLIEDDLWIDIGTDNKEDTMQKVSIGDLGVLEPVFYTLNGKYLCGTGIDDRIGLFVLTECLKWFKDNLPSSVCLHVIGTTQEEIGLRGAQVVAAQYPLDACFVVDVDYATDTLVSHGNVMGDLFLGKGVGIHIKSDNNLVLRKMVCDVADRCRIPYQQSLGRSFYGGTDSTAVQLQCGGIATMNINIPCRYMHSPIEVCNVNDVEAAIKLLINSIREIDTKRMKDYRPIL